MRRSSLINLFLCDVFIVFVAVVRTEHQWQQQQARIGGRCKLAVEQARSVYIIYKDISEEKRAAVCRLGVK